MKNINKIKVTSIYVENDDSSDFEIMLYAFIFEPVPVQIEKSSVAVKFIPFHVKNHLSEK